ncbi:MAG: bifunctional UDP-N-acetylglucosamine diphosphorylase/glucosamine-1-phosphate N-acetyltransferase GlmU [Holosporales bacterium]|jgi:bifunctional UDP-N-acetylglucosamine pyrophosphorylase/glucosamine-1-phosphate N-acetyltransferase|nr:bifunctional UDP-N-acetylglucosamine diphosphorylase/glucosamine-1-phosphate N-acetyltransferase GlmU [Holosporales bacterium]
MTERISDDLGIGSIRGGSVCEEANNEPCEKWRKSNVNFIILAGGLGTRTRIDCPKIFLPIAGKPIIRYIIDLCSVFSKRIIAVVPPQLNGHHLFDGSLQVVQETPKGTGDAVKAAIPFIDSEYVIIMHADTPLIEPRHIEPLLCTHDDAAFITCKVPKDMLDMPYGRVFCNGQEFVKIIEYKDANDNERSNQYVNTGIYKMNVNILKNNINDTVPNKLSGEYYLTDFLTNLSTNGKKISVMKSDEYWPFHGINTLTDLSLAETIVQDKLRNKFMKNGVQILDPKSVYFSFDSKVANNVMIEQNVVIKNGVTIHSGAIIKSFCYLENCAIMERAMVGPFARIRDEAVVMDEAAVGNFVEIKQSTVGRETKIKHLSYVGNTYVGYKSNIGAGTITCNYDGVRKHRSVIGDNVMIGANCSIISPIKIGDNTLIAAGSVITKDIPENTFAISRVNQQNYQNKASDIINKKKEQEKLD